MKLVEINYTDLINKETTNTEKIYKAFGPEGLGALLITNIPNLKSNKVELLKLSKIFGELDEEEQKNYESPETFYAFGWSKGKEKMKNGVPDTAKGSYYGNPIHDVENNIWPTEHIEKFEYNFKKMGNFMYEVGINVIGECDKYLKNNIKEYPKDYLNNIIGTHCKARLLHYYEQPEHIANTEDGACGWHLDHGGLTVLTKAIYFDKDFNEVPEEKGSGLYIKDMNGNTHHCVIPENALLCQVGEILQILSGGYVRATPHAVKSSRLKGVTRETFPVFIDCDMNQDISLPLWSKQDVLKTKGMDDLPGVPKLIDRYKNCKKYNEFVANTYAKYYN